MPKLRLDNAQRDQLSDSFEQIKNKLTLYIKGNTYLREFSDIETTVSQALSYAPEAALEYDKDRGGNYVSVVAYRSMLRFLDEIRANSINKYRQHVVLRAIKNIKEELQKSQGSAPFIQVEQILHDMNVPKTAMPFVQTLYDFHDHHDSPRFAINNCKEINEIDWQDTKQFIVKRCHEEFPGDGSGKYEAGSKNNVNYLYRTVILEYLLPKAEGEDHKNLEELSATIGITMSRLSQIIHSKRMKEFISNVMEINECHVVV